MINDNIINIIIIINIIYYNILKIDSINNDKMTLINYILLLLETNTKMTITKSINHALKPLNNKITIDENDLKPYYKYNKFDYLTVFKKNIINIIFKSFDNFTIKKDLINDLFIKWYLNNLNETYIPLEFNISSDLIYLNNKYKLNKNIDTINNEIKFELDLLHEKCNFVNEKYKFYKIFSNKQMELLRKKYTGDKYDDHIAFLSELFNMMTGFNNHLSIPPNVLQLYPEIIELFGTSVNTTNNYCSPFPIDKEYFGSLGNFFDYKIISGTYFANPPFDELIMKKMAIKLLDSFNSNKNITIIVVIPKWTEFECYDILIKSKYLKYNTILNKYSYKFYNYYTDKLLNIVDCYFIVLSDNNSFDYNKFISVWKN
jgi:hypothetical protein